jgi:hypothetical protein
MEACEEAFYFCSSCRFRFSTQVAPSYCPGCGIEITALDACGSAETFEEAMEVFRRENIRLVDATKEEPSTPASEKNDDLVEPES